MEVGSPEWIEASLAKLEQLEQQRTEHEEAIEKVKEPLSLRRHTDAFARLDREIKELYAQLESLAEDDEAEEEEEAPPVDSVEEPVVVPVASEVVSPATGAAFASPPFAGPAAVSDMSMSTSASSSYDEDSPRGSGKWIVLGVLLVGGLGVGGYFYMEANKPPVEKAAPAGTEVIKAADVPDDTEAPKAAKGADVDRTPLENQGGGKKPVPGGGSGTKKDDKKDDKSIKLGPTEDPLG